MSPCVRPVDFTTGRNSMWFCLWCKCKHVDLPTSSDASIGSSIMKALQRSALCSAHMLDRLQCRSRAIAHRHVKQAADGLDAHNAAQAEAFDPLSAADFRPEPPPAVLKRLDCIASAAPGLCSTSRVMDVDMCPGCLIPHLQALGVQDILAVQVSRRLLEEFLKRYGRLSLDRAAGNERQLRTFYGVVQNLPAYQGPFDAAFFNIVFGLVDDQRDTLLHTALLLKPGGYIVLGNCLGRKGISDLEAKYPDQILQSPHELPDRAVLEQLIWDLPLQLVDWIDEAALYCAVLQVPEGYVFSRTPLRLHGKVTTGFQRGSKQMGFPTANLPPEPLTEELEGLPKGVYFGWAVLNKGEHAGVAHEMVMNIGQNPTVNAQDAPLTVEVHIMHDFGADFYGEPVRVVVTGFIRPEMKFTGIDALISRIRTDAGIARKQLDLLMHQKYASDGWLLDSH